MSTDENTQEHAVEALDELITIPSIQVQLHNSLIYSFSQVLGLDLLKSLCLIISCLLNTS